jgi:serine phosphatase RsbU (regulator of sigma subunit)
VLYTDGVTDTRRGPERFGETRLADCLASTSGVPDEVITHTQATLGTFRSRPADDDVALIALRYDGDSRADAGPAA